MLCAHTSPPESKSISFLTSPNGWFSFIILFTHFRPHTTAWVGTNLPELLQQLRNILQISVNTLHCNTATEATSYTIPYLLYQFLPHAWGGNTLRLEVLNLKPKATVISTAFTIMSPQHGFFCCMYYRNPPWNTYVSSEQPNGHSQVPSRRKIKHNQKIK